MPITIFYYIMNLIYLPNTLRQRTELEYFWLKLERHNVAMLRLQGRKHIFGTC